MFTGLQDPAYPFLPPSFVLRHPSLFYPRSFWGHFYQLTPRFKTFPWLPISLRTKAKVLIRKSGLTRSVSILLLLAFISLHPLPHSLCMLASKPDKASISGPFQGDFLCLICCSLTYPHSFLLPLIFFPSPVSFPYHLYHLTSYNILLLLFWFGFCASPTTLNTPVLGSHQLSPNPT